MSMKTTVGAVSAAFFGVVLSASAAGTFYDAELTNSWISASLVPGLSTAGGAAVLLKGKPGWTAPQDGEAMATNTTIVFDTEVTDPLIYRPGGSSGAIALVNVNLLVEPNAAIPSSNGLESAQAALTVVTNSTSQRLEWVGLIGSGATNAWVVLSGDNPVQGNEYDVQIALDNRTVGEKKIRYAVKRQSDGGAYTVLRNGDDEWFPNPQNNASWVTAVAFAGAGTVGSFSGGSIVNDGATVVIEEDEAGFDFTNGTVCAVVTLPSDNSSGSTRTATLRLVKFDGTVQTYDAVTVTSGNEITWTLDNLTAGGVYSYSVQVKSGDTEREVKSGTFTAANWSSDWFGLEIVNAQATTNNGTFAGAEFNVTKWDVGSDALFTVTDIAPGSNAVVRVDTKYAFETFIDSGSLEALEEGVLGGIVATSDGGGAWYAYTGASNDTSGWEALTGGVVPNTNTDYVIRAEFDFLYSPHRVRYLVKADGSEFVPLAKGGSEWINLVNSAPGSLSSVAMTGKGYVKSINAKVADKAVVKDSTNKKFATIWDAIQNGTGPFTLLTNATLAPTGDLAKKTFTINEATFRMIIDRAGLGKWRLKDNGDGSYTLMKPGATYIFL